MRSRGHGGEAIQPHPLDHEEAQTGVAHEADDRGEAHVDVEPVECERGERGQDLRQDRVDDHLRPTGAGSFHRLDWSGIDALDSLGIELGQRGHGVEPQGQGPGEWTETHPHGENDGPQQRLDGADDVENGPHDIVDQHRDAVSAHQVAGGQEADRHSKYDAHDRGQEGQSDRLADLLDDQREGLRRLQPARRDALHGADGMGQRFAGGGLGGQGDGLGHEERYIKTAVFIRREINHLAVERSPTRGAKRIHPLHLSRFIRFEANPRHLQQIAHLGAGTAQDQLGGRGCLSIWGRQRIDAGYHDRR